MTIKSRASQKSCSKNALFHFLKQDMKKVVQSILLMRFKNRIKFRVTIYTLNLMFDKGICQMHALDPTNVF